ncbi:Vacuolar amino acid transporter 1 [Nymphaea thermarum]|nr:Vacuolar amino acid transporter 1 [Nymphaea thermarum]
MDIEHQLQQGASHAQTGTTFVKTCFNGLNALAGVGILSIPYALSEGGWVSLIFLVLVAAVCCYTGILLKRCMEADPQVRTYQDVGDLAFGTKGRITISAFLFLELFLVAVEFLILEGDNLAKLFPQLSFRVGGHVIGGSRAFIIISALVFLPTVWLRSLKLLSYVSAGGVIASVVLVASVLWAATVDGVGFHQKGEVFRLNGVPTTVSIITFCYCGHSLFPTICSSMKDRTEFPKVLFACFVICTFNYGSMAVIGYLMYGNEVKSQLTLNLPVEKLSSKIAIYVTLVNPLTKYALIVTPIAATIEDNLVSKSTIITSLLTRTTLVASTALVALAVPFFGYMMALIGSFLSITVSVLFPCICYLKICKGYRRSKLEVATIAVIMVVGCLIAIEGTYSSLQKIIQHLGS